MSAHYFALQAALQSGTSTTSSGSGARVRRLDADSNTAPDEATFVIDWSANTNVTLNTTVVVGPTQPEVDSQGLNLTYGNVTYNLTSDGAATLYGTYDYASSRGSKGKYLPTLTLTTLHLHKHTNTHTRTHTQP